MDSHYKRNCLSPELLQPNRAQCFEIPVSKSPEEVKENQRFVLELKPFASFPHVSFDEVEVGTSKICILYVKNPLDVPQTIQIEKFPFDKGFNVSVRQICVLPFQEQGVEIIWTPEKSLSCRETVFFKTSYGAKTQAYLHGNAISPKKKKKRKTWYPKKSSHAALDKMIRKSDLNKCAVREPVFDEKKENVDFSYDCQNFSKQSNLNLPSFDQSSDFPDVRRQTYTINSMFKDSKRNTGIFRMPLPKDNLCNKRKDTFVLSEISSAPLRELDMKFNLPQHSDKKYVSDIVNDSLEDSSFGANHNPSDEVNYNSNDVVDLGPNINVFSFSNEDIPPNELANNTKQLPHRESNIKSHLPEHSDRKYVSDSVNDSLEDSLLGANHNTSDEANYNLNNVVNLAPNINVSDFSNKNIPINELTNNTKQLHVQEETACESIFDFTIDRLGISVYQNKNADLQDRSNVKSLADELGRAGSNFINDSTLNSFLMNDKEVLSKENDGKIEVNLGGNDFNHKISDAESSICEPYFVVKKNYFSMFEKSDSGKFSKQSASGTNYNLSPHGLSIKSSCSPESNRSVVSSTYFEVPCSFSEKSNGTVSTNIMAKKKSRSPPKASVFSSKRHPKKSPLKLRMQRFKSPIKPKTINKMDNKKLRESASDVKILRNVPRSLSLRQEKLLEKLCQKNPFASVNAYYDEYWMEKQETAFTNWLNFILTPNDDFIPSSDVKVNSAQVWIESMKDAVPNPAPSKEELSYKTYTAAHQLNQLRKSSFSLYQSEKLAVVIKKIEKEVDMKKIIVRKDRAIHADLGIKRDLLKMLLSYNPLWLRIGLETIYGEIICLKNNRDILGLSRFIIFRFLSNPELVTKFTNAATPNYYKPGYEDELKRFLLKKFLLLVYFLDVAKNARLIGYNPCLFNKSSDFKSSRDMLLNFSKEYLSGEGDLTKHLRYLGCIVTYQQMPIEEFDYAVRNIATDLRCGLRLGKVLELLLHEWSIPNTLRVNTINRVNKIYNNDVILKALKKVSIEIEGNIDARDIVDGNREKTLSLLWQIIFKTQISKLLNKEILMKENAYLKRLLQLKADYAAFSAFEESKPENCDLSFTNSKMYEDNEILKHLLQWCQYVCAQYKLKVQNFTASFSDGRALCLMLHHYHPNILPFEAIKLETTSTFVAKVMECDETDSSPFMSENDKLSVDAKKRLLQNEKANWDLVFSKLHEIGQIPILSFPANVSNRLPDEKVMIIMVSYINIRLMELSSEIRAARTIQLAYRRWKLEKRLQKLKVEIAAARVIQEAWRKHLAFKRKIIEDKAAIIIQCGWRVYSSKKKLQHLKESKIREFLDSKATVIQALYRGYTTRKQLSKLVKAAIIIQKNIRMMLIQNRFSKLKRASLKIQTAFRAKAAGTIQRQKYLHLRNMVVKLQACSRGMILRKHLRRQKAAATVIQSYFKMHAARKRFLKLKESIIVIQRKFRSFLLTRQCYQNFKHLRDATIYIQKWYRLIQKDKREKKSAIKIQAAFRKYIHRKKYLLLKSATMKVQQWWRARIQGQKTRLSYLLCRRRIVLLQSLTRRYIARKVYLKHVQCIVKIQKNFRRMILTRKFKAMQNSASKIQAWWRLKLLGRSTRSSYLATRKHIILVQSLVRQYIAKKSYMIKRMSAIIIQKNVRRFLARKEFCKRKLNASKIQTWWRAKLLGRSTRSSYLNTRKHIITIQSLVRQFIAQKSYMRKKMSAVIIQKHVRRYLKKRDFCKKKESALKIQTWWRAKLLGKDTRLSYLMTRKRIILIQSLVRQFLAQKSYKSIKMSAVIIQKHVRRYLIRRDFCKKKESALKIQTFWRAKLLGKNTRASYLMIRKRIILIQSLVRRYIAQKTYVSKKVSAIMIQKNVRKFLVRKKFCKMQVSAIKIQAWWRLKLLGKNTRSSYLVTRKRVILLQSLVRQFIAQKSYMRKKTSAVMIQKHVRRYLIRRDFCKKKESALKIQTFWRAKLLGKNTRTSYLMIRKRIILIQSLVRRYIARKTYVSKKVSAVIIQKHVRRYLIRRDFCKKKESASKVQAWWRAMLLGKNTRSSYLVTRKRLILIQSLVRQYIAKKSYMRKRMSAIIIQKNVRRFLARKEFCKRKLNASTIQTWWRAKLLGKNTRTSYLMTRRRVILIQSLVRKFIAQKSYMRKKMSSVMIQKHVRRYLIRRDFCKKKESALKIQTFWRAKLLGKNTRASYLMIRKRIILIQSLVRRYIAQKTYVSKKVSAIMIQKNVRKFLVRKKFCKMQVSAIKIQAWWRLKLLGKNTRSSYLVTRKRVILLQSLVRQFIAQKSYMRKKTSAVMIQKHVRRYLIRTDFCKKKESALKIQTFWRAKLLGKNTRASYLMIRKRIILIQSLVRRYIARKTYVSKKVSAIMIQKNVRKFLVRKEFCKMQVSGIKIQTWWRATLLGKNTRSSYLVTQKRVILIQSLVRQFISQKSYMRKKMSAVMIQKHVRRYLIRRDFCKRKESALKIQTWWRAKLLGKNTRSSYLMTRKRVILIQSLVRQFLAQKSYKSTKMSAVIIQKYVRRYLIRRDFCKKQESASKIQAWWRLKLLGRNTRSSYLATRKHIILVQSLVRKFIAQKSYMTKKMSAVIIQKNVRRFLARKEFCKMKVGASKLQIWWRAILLGRNTRSSYLMTRKRIILIQSLVRRYIVQKTYVSKKMSAIIIQKKVRRFLVRKRFCKMQVSAIKIQTWWRAKLLGRNSRSSYLITRKQIILIQSLVRQFLARKSYVSKKLSAIMIQKNFRRFLSRKFFIKSENGLTLYEQQQWFTNLRRNVVGFQRAARLYLAKREKAAAVIQSFFRRCYQKKEKAALKIQAHWRGYSTRRNISNKLLLNIQKKIKNANSDEYHSLISRTNRAVDILLNSLNITKILTALKTLDTCTKLSSICCIRLEQSGGLSRLISLLISSNRSVPHKEIVTFCFSILLNLAKYDKTVNSVWEEEAMLETTVSLMKIWAKDSNIFNKCCCLLYIFCQDQNRAQVLKSISEFTYQVETLYKDVARKQKCVSQNTKIPRKSTINFHTRESKQIDPEWLLGNHRKRTFEDPLTAISSLMHSLGLKPNQDK